jgi:hypothetical protein
MLPSLDRRDLHRGDRRHPLSGGDEVRMASISRKTWMRSPMTTPTVHGDVGGDAELLAVELA